VHLMTTNPPHREPQNSNPQSSSSSSVRVPPTVYAQLEALRKSGIVNMYTEVHAGLSHFEFDEARQWLENNPDRYEQGFYHGFIPTDPELSIPSTRGNSSIRFPTNSHHARATTRPVAKRYGFWTIWKICVASRRKQTCIIAKAVGGKWTP